MTVNIRNSIVLLCALDVYIHVSTVLIQEISELQVIGRAPSPDVLVGRQRMRTDSLDSLGECESASEGDELPG